MLIVKFNLAQIEASTVHRLSVRSEQTFFVLGCRFQTCNNLWDARDNPKVEDTVKDNILHIERKAIFPTHELTGVCEVLLFKGSDPIGIADLESIRAADIGVVSK